MDNKERLDYQINNDKLSFTNILQLIIVLMLIINLAITQAIDPKSIPQETYVYNPRFTARLPVLPGWQNELVRGGYLVLEKETKKNEPTTTIVIYDEECGEQNCPKTNIPGYDDLQNQFSENPKFKMNSEWVYMHEGKQFTWFSFRVAKELLSDPVFEGLYLPELLPDRPLFTFVNIQQGTTWVTAIIISEEHYIPDQFEAESMIKKLEILHSNYLYIWD